MTNLCASIALPYSPFMLCLLFSSLTKDGLAALHYDMMPCNSNPLATASRWTLSAGSRGARETEERATRSSVLARQSALQARLYQEAPDLQALTDAR